MFIDFREKGREGERDTGRLLPVHVQTRDRTHNLFGVWDNVPPNLATQLGLSVLM